MLSDRDEVVMDLKDYVPESDPGIIGFDMKPGISAEGFSPENYMNGMESSLLTYLTTRCSSTYEMAKLLGVNQSTVVRKLKKYNIELKQGQGE
ncbi:MAG: hypothetical protein K5637_01135 [Lachnospiraceae bacterium]|nr:hypothetical protein [Lachnospiraceae bacterium]